MDRHLVAVENLVLFNKPESDAVGGLLAPGRVTHGGKFRWEVPDQERSKGLNGRSGGG